MATYTNNAEAGSDGTAVTTANSASPNAWTNVAAGAGGAIEFSDAQKMHGALAYSYSPASGVACYTDWQNVAGANNAASARVYVYLTGLPSANTRLLSLLDSTNATQGSVSILSTGALQVQRAAAATAFTTASSLSLNTWYRIEFAVTNATATTGSGTLATFLGDSSTPEAGLSDSITSVNFGTAALSNMRLGRIAASGTMTTFYVDDPAFATATSTLLGPAGSSVGLPVQDITIASWTPSSGTDIYPLLSDGSDTTFATTAPNPVSQVLEEKIQSMDAAPGTVTARLARSSDSTSGSAVVRLVQASTEIASWSIGSLNTAPTTYTNSLTVGERASITDLANLRIRVEMTVA